MLLFNFSQGYPKMSKPPFAKPTRGGNASFSLFRDYSPVGREHAVKKRGGSGTTHL